MRIAHLISVKLLAAGVCALSMHAAVAGDGDFVRGPVEARVERIIDGDTFVAVAQVWPGHSVRVSVRIRGIDAPETKSRCASEREAGAAAREALEALFGGAPVAISNIGGGKYYGRVLADVTAHDGRGAAAALLGAGLARHYSGGKREAFCWGLRCRLPVPDSHREAQGGVHDAESVNPSQTMSETACERKQMG